jgi:hypothetical protein
MVVTTTHDASHAETSLVPLSTRVHVRVQVTGIDGQPLDGSVTLYHHIAENCGGLAYGTVATLANGVVDGPGALAYTAPITRSFRVTFEGNATYRRLTGACHNVRWAATPTMTVTGPHDGRHQVRSEFEPNDVVHLRVVMSGAFGTPQGFGEIAAWKNGDCTGAPYASATGPLVDGIQDGNAGVAFDTPGITSVRARYLGEGQYLGVEGQCIPVTIAIPAPSPSSPPASAAPTLASPSAAPTKVAGETTAPSSSAPAGLPSASAASNGPPATGLVATPSPAAGAPSAAGASPGVGPSTAGSSAAAGESGGPSEPGTTTPGDGRPDGGAGLVVLAGTGLVGFLSLLAVVGYRRFGGRRLGDER